VSAVPPIPSSFWGTVVIEGSHVRFGSEVTAWINSVQYAQTSVILHQGQFYYQLDVPGDDPESLDVTEGGRPNDLILFRVDGLRTVQTAHWQSGSPVRLDLVVSPFLVRLPAVSRGP